MKKNIYILLIILTSTVSCKVNYSFTGASIPEDVKTVSISNFPSYAPLASAGLSQSFTEALKDIFLSQTNLGLIKQNGDLQFEGSITNYAVTSIAIQGNETAALNRLSITVSVIFINKKDEKQNFETSFTRFADYESSKSLASIEDDLIKDINDQLTQDIFNRSVNNW